MHYLSLGVNNQMSIYVIVYSFLTSYIAVHEIQDHEKQPGKALHLCIIDFHCISPDFPPCTFILCIFQSDTRFTEIIALLNLNSSVKTEKSVPPLKDATHLHADRKVFKNRQNCMAQDLY